MLYEKDVEVRCPICGKLSKIQAWNNNSKVCCATQEMKDDYMELFDSRGFTSGYYYKCPSCQMWSSGDKLKIKKDKE